MRLSLWDCRYCSIFPQNEGSEVFNGAPKLGEEILLELPVKASSTGDEWCCEAEPYPSESLDLNTITVETYARSETLESEDFTKLVEDYVTEGNNVSCASEAKYALCRVSSGEKETCPYCKKRFTRVREHIKRIHGPCTYLCAKPNCGKPFNTKKNLQSHWLRCYNMKKEFKCGTCQKEFHRKSNLVSHERRHSVGEFSCELCDKRFADSTGLRKHFLKHHDTAQEMFSSTCCQKLFKSREGLRKHLRGEVCRIKFQVPKGGKSRWQ